MRFTFPFAGLTALLAIFAGSVPARAQDQAPPKPEQVDLQPLTDYLWNYVYVLKQPLRVYHWFDATDAGPEWHQGRSSHDKLGYEYVMDSAESFWDSINAPAKANTYGMGLYAAIDPVISRSFGGFGNDWVLVQMDLPSGFRMLDLRRDGMVTLPLGTEETLKALDCPKSWVRDGLILNQLFSAQAIGGQPNSKGRDLSSRCQAALEKIFREVFKIDGFAYPYMSTPFKDCSTKPESPSQGPGLLMPGMTGGPFGGNGYTSNGVRQATAFVITSDRWVKPENIRYFNRATSDDLDTRIGIQSMFYKATLDMPEMYQQMTGNPFMPVGVTVPQSFPKYPGYTVNGIPTSNCDNTKMPPVCKTATVILCHPTNGTCVKHTYDLPTAPPSPAPSDKPATWPLVMSAENAPSPQFTYNGLPGTQPEHTLLWPDMAGKTTQADVGPWMKAHLMGCTEGTPYISARKFERELSSHCLTEDSPQSELDRLLRDVASAAKR